MDDNDVTQDIRSVFKHSMRNDHLPPAYTGGGSKQLSQIFKGILTEPAYLVILFTF